MGDFIDLGNGMLVRRDEVKVVSAPISLDGYSVTVQQEQDIKATVVVDTGRRELYIPAYIEPSEILKRLNERSRARSVQAS